MTLWEAAKIRAYFNITGDLDVFGDLSRADDTLWFACNPGGPDNFHFGWGDWDCYVEAQRTIDFALEKLKNVKPQKKGK